MNNGKNDYFESIGAWHGNGTILRAYVIGFVCSLVCTIAAYMLVERHTFETPVLFAIIFALALVQFLIQLICFLHLGSTGSVRPRILAIAVTTGIVMILIAGSLWIMATLNARMMPGPDGMTEYMQNQTGM